MGLSFTISIIYGTNSEYERRDLWNSLRNIHPTVSGAWLMTGDFNVVNEMHEKQGGKTIPFACLKDFNRCIEDCGLFDLRVEGGSWSLSNSFCSDNRIVGRLDRTLVNQDWINSFPISYCQYLPTLTSDHSLMVIHMQNLPVSGPKPFRFLNRWCNSEGFLDTVKEGWSLPVQEEICVSDSCRN